MWFFASKRSKIAVTTLFITSQVSPPRNQTLSFFHCAQIFKVNSLVDVHSKTSAAWDTSHSTSPFFLPLAVRRGVKKNSFIFTCSFKIFSCDRLKVTRMSHMMTRWMLFPKRRSHNRGGTRDSGGRSVGICRPSRRRRRSLKTGSSMNLTRLNRQGEQFSVT